MTDAEIVAKLFGCPCDFSPMDEEILAAGECEETCGLSEQDAAKCWQRYFDLKRNEQV